MRREGGGGAPVDAIAVLTMASVIALSAVIFSTGGTSRNDRFIVGSPVSSLSRGTFHLFPYASSYFSSPIIRNEWHSSILSAPLSNSRSISDSSSSSSSSIGKRRRWNSRQARRGRRLYAASFSRSSSSLLANTATYLRGQPRKKKKDEEGTKQSSRQLAPPHLHRPRRGFYSSSSSSSSLSSSSSSPTTTTTSVFAAAAAASSRRLAVSPSVLKSVVKVFCTDVKPNFALPWQMEQQGSSFSSGFVISGNRILTNAHGVAWHNVVRVRKHGDSRKYVATVEHVAHECDLAILKVEDSQFWSGLEALSLGTLPELQDKIKVVGYPQGGDRISITQGIVSRVEMGSYSHSGEYLLMIQIDAAINSGNSGGPALDSEGRVAGVAFQALDEAENIGYIIPVPIIDHFLTDIKLHGNYTGFCRLGVSWQTTENEAMRQYLQLKAFNDEIHAFSDDDKEEEEEVDDKKGEEAIGKGDDPDYYSDDSYEDSHELLMASGEEEDNYEFDDDDDAHRFHYYDTSDDTGVLVTHVEPKMPTAKVLKAGDVIAALDGIPIASDGTVPFRGEERVLFSHILRSKYPGDLANMTIIRHGQRLEETVQLMSPPQLVPWYMYDRNPSYLLYSGLVFTPLSVPYLMAEFGHRWQRYAPVGLLEPAMYGIVNEDGEEVVVLTQVLASDATTGYEDINNVRVMKMNGIAVTSLRQLLRLLTENKDDPFVCFEVGNSPTTAMQIILNTEEAEAETGEILAQNKIPERMSVDLKRWLEDGMPEFVLQNDDHHDHRA